jgi:hypothetical protein
MHKDLNLQYRLSVTMLGWIKIGDEFIKSLAGQWKGSPNASSETANTMAEETPGADSVAVGDESQISIKTGASPNQQEIERRREVVRQLFNDFWVSAEDKPGTFASASIGPKATSTNDWLRVERHGSLTPRVGNSSASRRLNPV